jgi:CRP-like cAMP-binding protein
LRSIRVHAPFPYDLNHMTQHSELISTLQALLPPALHKLCETTRLKKNFILFETGKRPHWMFFVVSGEVTLERLTPEGGCVVLQRTRHGFVSEASLQSDQYHCDGRVVADAEIAKIPIRELSLALASDSDFSGRWIRMLNLEVKRLRLQCERLSMKSVKDKVIHLIQTEGRCGQYVVNTGLKTLAGELGVTHEALYRTLAALEKSGQISRTNGVLALN